MVSLNSLFPYQNKSLANVHGEVWKDVPGFERTYQASTMGRIKSLDRLIPHPRLHQQFVKGQIMSQSVAKNRNIKTGDPMIDLRVSFAIENTVSYFNARRVIYKTFIDPHLDYKKGDLYIITLMATVTITSLKIYRPSQRVKNNYVQSGVTMYCHSYLKLLTGPGGEKIILPASQLRSTI